MDSVQVQVWCSAAPCESCSANRSTRNQFVGERFDRARSLSAALASLIYMAEQSEQSQLTLFVPFNAANVGRPH